MARKNGSINDIGEAGFSRFLHKGEQRRVRTTESFVSEDAKYLNSATIYDEIIVHPYSYEYVDFAPQVFIEIPYKNQNYSEIPECLGFVSFDDKNYKLPFVGLSVDISTSLYGQTNLYSALKEVRIFINFYENKDLTYTIYVLKEKNGDKLFNQS